MFDSTTPNNKQNALNEAIYTPQMSDLGPLPIGYSSNRQLFNVFHSIKSNANKGTLQRSVLNIKDQSEEQPRQEQAQRCTQNSYASPSI